MRVRSVTVVAVVAASLWAVPRVARADAATAEALFREGRAQMDAGNFAAACPKLAESYGQDPATGTLLALAMCQEQAGNTASAWATFSQVVSRAKKEGRLDRADAAREHASALEPRLSRLTINVDAGTATLRGLVVIRDGEAVGPGAWGTGVPVDPGEHTIQATAPGKKTWKTIVTVGKQADSQTIAVPALEAEATTRTASAPSASPGGPATAAAASEEADFGSTRASPLGTVGLVAGGVGIIGLGLGVYFGLQAKSLNDESNADGHCVDNLCDRIGGAKRDDAKSAATLSTVTFVAGGVLTAAGVTLFVIGGPNANENTARARVVPALGPGVAGLVLEGRY